MGHCSGPCGCAIKPNHLRQQRKLLARRSRHSIAGDNGDASIAALRKVPAEQIIAAVQADPSLNNFEAMPIVDGEVIPQELEQIFANGEQADVPVLIGSNADESTVLCPILSRCMGKMSRVSIGI